MRIWVDASVDKQEGYGVVAILVEKDEGEDVYVYEYNLFVDANELEEVGIISASSIADKCGYDDVVIYNDNEGAVRRASRLETPNKRIMWISSKENRAHHIALNYLRKILQSQLCLVEGSGL